MDQPAKIVEEYRLHMIPDPGAARRYCAPELDVVAGGTQEETMVYQTGTLYGEWPDGTPSEGNRYVDRRVVRRGKIVSMEVRNDSAERLLVRAGLARP
jgi:hypothetical protein